MLQRERAQSLERDAGRSAVQVQIDGIQYTERDYLDIASATQAIAQILRNRAERLDDLDEDGGDEWEAPGWVRRY